MDMYVKTIFGILVLMSGCVTNIGYNGTDPGGPPPPRAYILEDVEYIEGSLLNCDKTVFKLKGGRRIIQCGTNDWTINSTVHVTYNGRVTR